MTWINRILPVRGRTTEAKPRSNVPEGLWKQCPRCSAVLYRPELEHNLDVCSKCQHHLRISARRRIEIFLDPEDQVEVAEALTPEDKIKFKDTKKYKDRLTTAQKNTGEKDALVVVRGLLKGHPVVVAAFEFQFLGGSMGHIVGERFVKACEVCLAERLPLVCFATSGGARMQEAMISLMQMAKTSAALERMKQAGIPYLSVLVDPVFGGVSASLAMLGDINIAEPNALVGFTGPNVIKQTIKVELPDGFQRSEFLLKHGAIDMIVERSQMRDSIARLLNKLMQRPPTLSPIIDSAEEIEENEMFVSELIPSVEPTAEISDEVVDSKPVEDIVEEEADSVKQDQLAEVAAQSAVDVAQNLPEEQESAQEAKKEETAPVNDDQEADNDSSSLQPTPTS